MFTKDELNTIAVLLKSGIKTMDLTGNNLIIAGAVMKKLEDLLTRVEPKTEIPGSRKEEIPSKKQKNP